MPKKDPVKEEVRKLKAKIENLKRQVRPKVEQGKQFVAKEEKEVETYIRQHPMKSVGVAFAVGFLIGKMSR